MGKSFGPWEILEQIGEGGAGHVFKVKHTETGEIGALKRLKNTNRRERFTAEVGAVRQLDHPGIVRLIDANLDDEPFYAVYEYEPGGSIGDLSTEELLAIPLAQRLNLCEQVCDALEAAHKASIVHRDVKPDNILITPDRKTARLCDFGLVFCEDGERHTATMEQIGSRYFIPPEMEDGRADQVSASSDVYSMGKVIYYMVSGRIFARERHRDQAYDLSKVVKDPYLEAVSRILDDAITPDPGSRKISSAAMLRLLLSMAREDISARRPIRGVPATYKCVFCGVGTYKPSCISSEGHNEGYHEGNIGQEQMVFLECDNCGNCQRFKLKTGGDVWFPEAYERWKSRR
jgi:serine/threonine protein kinase